MNAILDYFATKLPFPPPPNNPMLSKILNETPDTEFGFYSQRISVKSSQLRIELLRLDGGKSTFQNHAGKLRSDLPGRSVTLDVLKGCRQSGHNITYVVLN